jgi:hypothetical protein
VLFLQEPTFRRRICGKNHRARDIVSSNEKIGPGMPFLAFMGFGLIRYFGGKTEIRDISVGTATRCKAGV